MSFHCDYLFQGGCLVDGSGDERRFADVAVKGSRIEAVGSNLAQTYQPGRTIDITGKVISPGFIDLHTHSDLTVLVNPLMESSVHQGVTTELFGNCGMSVGLMHSGPQFEMERRWMDRGNIQLDWAGMDGFLRRVESTGIAINVATLAGHGTIRKDILDYAERPPDAGELDLMKARLQSALDDGAFGLSSGLEYLPGGYADLDELCALADLASTTGGFYASHIRDERDHLVSSVEEALEVGRRSHLPVQLSHHKVERKRNWGTVRRTLAMMRDARESGMDVSTDQYPYTAFMTGLTVILLPQWAQAGGGSVIAETLGDPQARQRIVDHIIKDDPEWDQIRIGFVKNRRDALGVTLSELGSREGRSPLDAALALLVDEQGMVGAAYFAMSEDDVDTIITDEYTMIGSDGVAAAPNELLGQDKIHPRTYGTFPRVLGEYVRRRGLLSLEEAIRKMTSLPASRLRLADRGYVEAGFHADLVVFNPDTVVDVATFDEPHRFASGIEHVVVNGQIAIENGKQADVLAGRVLRRV